MGSDSVFVYIYDLLGATVDEKKHLRHLAFVFQRQVDRRLIMNAVKFQFRCLTVNYLGHLVFTEGYLRL